MIQLIWLNIIFPVSAQNVGKKNSRRDKIMGSMGFFTSSYDKKTGRRFYFDLEDKNYNKKLLTM